MTSRDAGGQLGELIVNADRLPSIREVAATRWTFEVVTIHGGMKCEERRTVQDRFRIDDRVWVMVATDAAGEGVNLQVANLMVNYVELSPDGVIGSPGGEPYLDYRPLTDQEKADIDGHIDLEWADHTAEVAARKSSVWQSLFLMVSSIR